MEKRVESWRQRTRRPPARLPGRYLPSRVWDRLPSWRSSPSWPSLGRNWRGERARAISTVVVGGTLGAIVGPLIAGPMSRIAAGLGLDELSGPYGASTGLFVAAAAVIFLLLRPEPRDLGRAIASRAGGATAPREPTRTIPEIYAQRPAQVATEAMVCGQLVMVMLMVITPLHMRGHHHAISTISYVISGHVVGMYAFSVVSGQLADRWGRGPVVMAGATVLILACLAATLSPQVLPLTVALFRLGRGLS